MLQVFLLTFQQCQERFLAGVMRIVIAHWPDQVRRKRRMSYRKGTSEIAGASCTWFPFEGGTIGVAHPEVDVGHSRVFNQDPERFVNVDISPTQGHATDD